MDIQFTKHALERCARRRINKKKLEGLLLSVPKVTGVMEWTFPNGIAVVINDTAAARLVVTVKKKKGKPRKRVKW